MPYTLEIIQQVLYNLEIFNVNSNIQHKIVLNFQALVTGDDECSLCFLPTNTDAILIVGASQKLYMKIKIRCSERVFLCYTNQ